ncbi:hypothetical protein J6590_001632 [Homalodisca vitripennis]|nr:hypothetical protein J6590_001632 [Homalodisca vitripennis]
MIVPGCSQPPTLCTRECGGVCVATTYTKNHKRVQLREEPILPVILERPTRTERRCQTCSPL